MQRRARFPLYLLVLTCALAVAAAPSQAGPRDAPAAAGASAAAPGDIALKYKPMRTWRIDLPAPTFRKVSGDFDLTAVGGKRYAVEVAGSGLRVDTDGDGELDAKVHGKTGFLRFKGDDGFSYAVRLVSGGTGWLYAASGARVGKLGGVKITLIDQDGNGSYADFGKDAMIVGSSRNASFLSRVVNVGGRLHHIDVSKDGATLAHKPFAGAVGTLDAVTELETDAKLVSAILRNKDGDVSFDLGRARSGLLVPAGRYTLHSGLLGLGDSIVRVRTGSARTVEVAPDARVSLSWGGPVRAEFAYQRFGDEVVLAPETVRYFGRAGEEYYDWRPFGKSPEFTIVDAKARKEIAKAIFTGC